MLKDKVLSSQEFNGDMYPEGHGDQALELLTEVTTEEQFKQMVASFNNEWFEYEDQLVWEHTRDDVRPKLNFDNRYFDLEDSFCWFSDWIFINNQTGLDITFTLRDWQGKYVLKSGKTCRFNYGRIGDEDITTMDREEEPDDD